MRLRSLAALALFVLALCASHAQSATPAARQPPETATSFGTVTGHITIAGSNAPARFATVALQPIEIKEEEDTSTPGKRPSMSFSVYQTGLDGSYTIPRVAPGRYYVVVTQPGYLSPFDQFTREELQHVIPVVQQRIDQLLPVILVRPNASSTMDIQLQRGADLSGTVRFDDGTPFASASVSIMRRDSSSKWVSPRAHDSFTTTGDDGHWHLSGLLAGDYRVQVDLHIDDRKQSSLLSERNFMMMRSLYSLTVYAGDTTRERDATVVTLTDGQDLGGQDISIPVSKLHPLSGAVVDSRTSQPVNCGKVELVYADDGKQLTSTEVDYDTGAFTFNFVPEGEYKLVVKNARRIRRDTAVSDDMFAQPAKETVLREYGPGEVPLTTHGEMSGVTLPVEAKPKSTSAAAQ